MATSKKKVAKKMPAVVETQEHLRREWGTFTLDGIDFPTGTTRHKKNAVEHGTYWLYQGADLDHEVMIKVTSTRRGELTISLHNDDGDLLANLEVPMPRVSESRLITRDAEIEREAEAKCAMVVERAKVRNRPPSALAEAGRALSAHARGEIASLRDDVVTLAKALVSTNESAAKVSKAATEAREKVLR